MEIAWTIVSVVVGILLTIAFAVIGYTPAEFRVARACLWLSAILLAGTDLAWQVITEQPMLWRLIVGLSIGALVFVGLPETLRWVKARQDQVAQLPPPSATSPPPEAFVIPRSTHPDQSPIEGLSRLGWTVKPGNNDIQFEIANRALPEMQESASYFKQLKKPFALHFQSVKSIHGLRLLAEVPELTKIEISAGEFTDISDLSGLVGITHLIISQTPIDGLGVVDVSPLSSLINLRELGLGMSRVVDLGPLRTLTKLITLNLIDIPARDLSPLANLTLIQSLSIRGAMASDLSPLIRMRHLKELEVDGKQAAGLGTLSDIDSLKTLRLIEQRAAELSAVGDLRSLESIWVWGPPRLDLSPLRRLTNVKQVTIQGLGIGVLSIIADIDALGTLKTLTKLTLAQVNVNDLRFVNTLSNLSEINLARMPISSIEGLRALGLLESVSLNQVQVGDISPLLDLPRLAKLDVFQTPARADVLTELERRGVKIRR